MEKDRNITGKIRMNRQIQFILTEMALLIVVVIIYHFLLNRCSVLKVPHGHISSEEHSSMAGFQDFNDFYIYRYTSASDIEKDNDYKVMSDDDAEKVREYFDYFKEGIDSENMSEKCSLAAESVSAGDYYILDTKEGQSQDDFTYGKFDNYSIWFFDVESLTLYYIHSNV